MILDVTYWASVAGIVGAPVGVIALIYGALQLRSSAQVSRGQFMLELERMIAVHDEVHLKLRPGANGLRAVGRRQPRNGQRLKITWGSSNTARLSSGMDHWLRRAFELSLPTASATSSGIPSFGKPSL